MFEIKLKLKHKRGIPFPTHIVLSVLALAVQIVFFAIMMRSLSKHYIFLNTLCTILAIIMVFHITNRSGKSSYKILWIIFILALPIFGVTSYLFFGDGRVLPYVKKRMMRCEEKYITQLPDDKENHDALRYSDSMHSRQADYLTLESGYPLYKNSSVEFLAPGEEFLPRFLEELEKAEKYIFIEFFIIAEGKMWSAVSDILERKVEQGVEVKVMFDDFGSIKRQSKNFIKRLRKKGIEVAVFNKIRPSLDIFMNNRNHRKIVVIDGKTAVTGGLNLADEYINELERFGYWMDCAVIVKGDAVKNFLAMFCSTWEFTTGKEIDMDAHISEEKVLAKGFLLPYADGPLDNKNPAEGIYMQIINSAQRYIYIATPYLIIDNSMKECLSLAAKSGIDVKIITPHIPDKWYVHPVTQYNYYDLLEAGVKIYEYTPGFIHSKFFVSDDRVATVGTVNMDYRSFIMHFECGVWMCDNETVYEIKDHFNSLLLQCEEMTLEKMKKSSIFVRLKRSILHLFAPFM
ncbi:MAG: cardiolipin synthase [Acutalibacteraceae bacterium]|nr:cardiolipin synthase [Acutalibacteraceae bacterium]